MCISQFRIIRPQPDSGASRATPGSPPRNWSNRGTADHFAAGRHGDGVLGDLPGASAVILHEALATAQITLCFEESPIQEARINHHGSLTGPALIREWWPDRNQRAAAWLVVRRFGGEYCYAVSSQIGSCYSGFATSLKWNGYSDFNRCLDAGMAAVGKRIHDTIVRNDSDTPKAGLRKLLAAFEHGEFVEKINGDDA